MKPLVLFFVKFFCLIFFVSCNALVKTESPSFSTAYVDLEVLYHFVLQNDPDYKMYQQNSEKPVSIKLLNNSDEIKRSVALKVEDAVRYIASENGFKLVINKKSTIVYADKQLDITQSVINELRLRHNRRSLDKR
ncbi:MAG TPA: OmpH family outer membrane protein [Spirochaetota bacterium]|nr:OmpH family outer membrane protein [Spirochaetota bacterium]